MRFFILQKALNPTFHTILKSLYLTGTIFTSQEMQLRTKSTLKAMTLVELLIVMTILSILSAMLFPCLGKAVLMSRTVSCVNQQRQFGQAAILYASDYNNCIPPYRIYMHTTGYIYEWAEACSLYLSSEHGLYQCPSRSGSPSTIPVPYWNNSSYSCNTAISLAYAGDVLPVKLNSIRDPAGTFYLMDGTCGRVGYAYTWAWEGIKVTDDRADFRHNISAESTLGYTNEPGGLNVLFPAGNAQTLRRHEVPYTNTGGWTLLAGD
jgi:prepilin-type N-terminal cleavage/methylation domain-containing protein